MTDLGRQLAAIPGPRFALGLSQVSPSEQRALLRARFRYDELGMVRFLWGAHYSRPFAEPHTRMLTREKVPWSKRMETGQRHLRAIAAPRGISKTGTTIADLCHDVLYGIERVVPILSAELGLSRQSLASIRELLSADSVTELYGPCTFKGGTDRYTVTTADGHACTFIAKSFGTSVRGLKEGMVRPTRLVVDDGEDKHRVNNPDQRRRWRDFLAADILKLGDLSGGLIVDWLGTVLHADSVLAGLLKDPGWHSVKYAAMVQAPTRSDLWDACAAVWADLGRRSPWVAVAEAGYAERWRPGMKTWGALEDAEQRREIARAFYEGHRDDMDVGAVMLAPAWISVFDYHIALWAEGRASVRKELDNDPINPDDCLFDVPRIRRCRFDGTYIHTSRGTRVAIDTCKVGIWLDHSKGKKTSDYPAICTVARDREGWRYWIGCDLTRRQPTARHEALWAAWERFARLRPKVGMDATGTQGLLGEAMQRIQRDRRNAQKAWDMDLREYEYTSSEGSAVSLIHEWEPAVANGWIELDEGLPSAAWDQIRDFPSADHDDALAAAERADWLLNPVSMPTVTRSAGLGG